MALCTTDPPASYTYPAVRCSTFDHLHLWEAGVIPTADSVELRDLTCHYALEDHLRIGRPFDSRSPAVRIDALWQATIDARREIR